MRDTYNPQTKENSVEFPEYSFSKYTEYCEECITKWDVSIPNTPTPPEYIQQTSVKIYVNNGKVEYVEWISDYEVIDVDQIRENYFIDLSDVFTFTKEMARHDIEKYFDWIGENCVVVSVLWEEICIESKLWRTEIDKNIVKKCLPTEVLLSKKK